MNDLLIAGVSSPFLSGRGKYPDLIDIPTVVIPDIVCGEIQHLHSGDFVQVALADGDSGAETVLGFFRVGHKVN